MKKLFSFFMLLLATVFATNVIAQQHVYINDNFAPQGKPTNSTLWNQNTVSDVGSITMVDGSHWPAWFYDETGGTIGSVEDNKIQGLYTVESNIIRVDKTGELALSMDFYAITKEASNIRNFGARIRLNTGNEWDTVFALRPQGGRFPIYDEYEGRVEVSIGDKYNDKYVIFQIFFYNDSIATDPFMMSFSNVLLATYGSEPMVQTELVSGLLASGDIYNATLNCTNQSTTSIASVEYAYSVNGKAAKKDTVFIDDSLRSRESVTFSFSLDITDADLDTTNRMQIWPIVVNGEAYVPQAGDTLDFTLTVVDEARLDQDYVPMLESFTAATCLPCRQLNPYLNPVLAELKAAGKLNVVKYQMDFPAPDKYYIVGNGTRATYYSLRAVPTLVLNGQERPIPEGEGYYATEVVSTVRDMVEDASQNKAFFSIKVNRAELKADSMLVKLDFDIISHIPGNVRATIHAMVIEGTTRGNKVSNSEKEFHYVNMKFVTPASGRNGYFAKDRPVNYTYSVDMNNTNVEDFEDLQVVIFVQDPTDQYIYQSAGVVMGSGDVAVEDAELAQVSLYPNPAAHTVYVKGLERARVEIFDLAGRKVYETVDASDVLEISLASFAKGAYVVRIAQKGAVASRKLVVK